MSKNQIKIKNISLRFPHKTCFEDFSATVYQGSKIGIIGRNGSGKSSLLRMIAGNTEFDGEVIATGLTIGYVPQIVTEHEFLSGGQRFNKALSHALALDPDVLLLDEPTNHLDLRNRKSLMRMLSYYSGTLIVATHDVELLSNVVGILWHINAEEIKAFQGNYDDYMRELGIKLESVESEISHLNRQKKGVHESLMKEQSRAKSSKSRGEKSINSKKWPTIVSNAKAGRAQETSGNKKLGIRNKREDLMDKLSNISIQEVIKPKFSLSASSIGSGNIIQINDGRIGYDYVLPSVINFSLGAHERMAISGKNGSGKTTLVKAILGEESVKKYGEWIVPDNSHIGYLDQHYGILIPDETIIESITNLVPSWSSEEIRKHLNDFLFRKNEEVATNIKNLSGGEKARLCLAHIAAKTPKLLILDEITNNLDIETKEHVIQVLQAYSGAMLIISHDEDFLERVGVISIFSMD